MGTSVNSEDANEMQHNAAFNQSLFYLLRQELSSEKENNICL